MIALRANAQVFVDLLAKQGRLAAVAAHPDAFRHALWLEVPMPGVRRSSVPRLPWLGSSCGLRRGHDRRTQLLSTSSSLPEPAFNQEAVPLPRSSGAISIHSKPRGGRLLVEVDTRLAFQIADDHLGQRLADNQSDRLVVMALEQRSERRLDSSHRALRPSRLEADRSSPGRRSIAGKASCCVAGFRRSEALARVPGRGCGIRRFVSGGSPGPCRRFPPFESRSRPDHNKGPRAASRSGFGTNRWAIRATSPWPLSLSGMSRTPCTRFCSS